MKKYINQIMILLIGIVFYSCSQDKLDDINFNVNDPSEVSASLIITDVMVSSAFSVIGSDLAFYASTYIEHNVGVFGQMNGAEIRVAQPTSSSTYNNTWDGIYTNLLNLKDIIKKCSPEGTEEGNFHTLGIAQILTAYNLGVLTDVMGDVPWTEALQPGVIFTPNLDSQESIYAELFVLLDEGISNLEKETTFGSLGKQDVIYGGNTDNWIKMAYGLKARHTMRLSLKSPDYANVIAFANKSFTKASEQAQFDYNGGTSKSPFQQFMDDRDYFGASTSLHNKLTDRDDPRDSIFFKPYPNTGDDLVFAINGSNDQAQGKYSVSGISDITAPTYLLSYHEIEFLKAEAYARLDQLDNAKEALGKAITAAFGKVNIGLSSDVAETYYTDEVEPKLTNKNNALREIMVQKYLAFYEEEAVEAYNDYRRLKAMGEDFIVLANPLNNASKFPLRFTYGSSDVTTNVNVREAYGDGNYVYTENVWWAGGTR
ncbi:SusD/RagB family nutrient-binding outer membrane lipoprotein [Gelidibacter salicanalis]|uniref:SusD/RagB family nutrient-binding outer membrane lipoprotein n=1 Tax=Gelidibacter salicanalis TaxID=291193 RepID=A0A934KT23_9FLAO|nr:SusD/RagB family nutrient-binding outer membrane lipoprotein [Gelidibacter salicanalis]MBJ7880212.1 SusD/RagB family nutrient-binding outer membrane lipoprotein [Gelidibacter salicanalis]